MKLLLYWVLTLLAWLLSTWRNLQDRWRAWRDNTVPLAQMLMVHSMSVAGSEVMKGPCSGALFTELVLGFGVELNFRLAAGEVFAIELENLSDEVLPFIGCVMLRHRDGGRSVLPFRRRLVQPRERFTVTAIPAVGGNVAQLMIPSMTAKRFE